jgi:integrase
VSTAADGAPTAKLSAVPGGRTPLDEAYAADIWRAAELGVRAPRNKNTVSFSAISQPWLRQAAKDWSRQRLAVNCAFATVEAGVLAFKRFSAFLASCDPPVQSPNRINRALIERYLAWLAPVELSESTKRLSRVFLRAFLEENRRYRWVGAVPVDAVVYHDELSARRASLPRFVPEFVMSQLEAEAKLAKLRPDYRHLVVLLTETGLRAGDACSLVFDPLVTDSSGWPCLCFQSWKMRNEQMVPLSAKAIEAVRAQQRLVEQTWPERSPWLFPSRPDPGLPQNYNSFRLAFAAWQQRIGLHDEAGRPTRVSAHRLRHSFGTRLVNQGVPQHVIQRLLGHASPEMTATYAHLHDTTLRKEFERYCRSRVDIEGRLLGFDPDALTADAEWVKHNLARTADTLPNGYCGRPPQQECPHPNACLTCAQFQTTVEFLPVHRQQKALTADLIVAADAAGRQRLADNHRRVAANLDKIITALEDLAGTGND